MGNPCADVARTLILLNVPGKDLGISRFKSILKILFRTLYFWHYIRISKYSVKQINDWLPVHAFIRLGENIQPGEKKKWMRFFT